MSSAALTRAPASATGTRDAEAPGHRLGGSRPRLPPLGLLFAWLVIATVILWAIAPSLFASHNPIAGIGREKLLPPSAAHLLGTDALGRDMFARIVYGSVHSLSGAFLAVTVGLVVGTLLGLIAGARGGFVDTVAMRIVDTLLSIPQLFLSLAVIVILGFGTMNAAIAVGAASIARFARLSRSEVLRVQRNDYVEAAYGSGGGFLAVLWRHILPNSMTPVLALAALQFGLSILQISTLGFLGYGAPPPTPEWGLLIAEGRNYISRAWWLTTAPGLVIVLVVVSANRISRSFGGTTDR